MPTATQCRGCDNETITVSLVDSELRSLPTSESGTVLPGQYLCRRYQRQEDRVSYQSSTWYGPGASWDGVAISVSDPSQGPLPSPPIPASHRRYECSLCRIDITPLEVTVSRVVVIPCSPAPPIRRRKTLHSSQNADFICAAYTCPASVFADAIEEFLPQWNDWFAQETLKELRSLS
jgi:hypothetical protein